MGVHPTSTVSDHSGAKKFKPFTTYGGTKRHNLPGDIVNGSVKVSQAFDQTQKKQNIAIKGTISKALCVRSNLKVKCGAVRLRHFEHAVILLNEKLNPVTKGRCSGSTSSLLKVGDKQVRDANDRHINQSFNREY